MTTLYCSACGKELKRMQDVKYATCFDCKMERNRERSRKAYKLKKEKNLK